MAAAEDRRPALTDAQIDAIAESMERGPSWDLRQFARAVERAMGPTLGVADTDMPFLTAQKMAEENRRLSGLVEAFKAAAAENRAIAEAFRKDAERLDALLDEKAKEHTALFLSARGTAKDAARYCWLRDCAEQEIQFDHTAMEAAIGVLIPCRWTNDEPSLDAAIDARIAQLNKETQA